MEYYNNILCIEASWLIEHGIMSFDNYKKMAIRKDITIARRGCRGTSALVKYDDMPSRFKEKVEAILGDVHKEAQRNMIIENIVENQEASKLLESFQTADGKFIPPARRREYYANAVLLDSIRRIKTNRQVRRTYKVKRFWPEMVELLDSMDGRQKDVYPHALPANARALERKYNTYITEGTESLIHKSYKIGQKSAAKISTEEQEAFIATLISDQHNIDNEKVARLYNIMAEALCWKEITASTVAVWRDKLDNVIYARRHGEGAYLNNKAMQVKRKAPSFPLTYWTLDGWDAELMYQEKEGDKATTYHHRPCIVVVLDACCKYPIGYAIGRRECPSLIQEALRNAVRHTEQLFGTMYRTSQVQSDRYAFSKMKGTYETIGDKVTPAQAHNAKAKIIEPWFKFFNRTYCQNENNWSGYGVTSRKSLQPNVTFLAKNRNNYPDYMGCCAQLIRFIESERARLHDKYVALFAKIPAENLLPLSREQYLLNFGCKTERNLLQGSGLNVKINGVKHTFDCFDDRFRDYSSIRWEVRYDPDNLQYAVAVNEDETLRFEVEEKYVQPMALAEREERDNVELQRIRAYNERQNQLITERISNYTGTARALVENHNQRIESETLKKLIIPDSLGQHKDRRSDCRLAAESVAKPLPAPPRNDEFDESDLLNDY